MGIKPLPQCPSESTGSQVQLTTLQLPRLTCPFHFQEFFNDLEVHKAMLDSLASQCDTATQDNHSMQHTRLSNMTHVLVDQASLHGQRLERLVRQWSQLADKLGHLQHFLKQVNRFFFLELDRNKSKVRHTHFCLKVKSLISKIFLVDQVISFL